MPLDEANMFIASKVIEISETDSYIDLVDRVCYYDNPNLNRVQLDYDDKSLEKAQTLVNAPVLAHYKVDAQGNPTLGGHEMKIVNGKTTFGTQAIGTHLDVKIEDSEVELVSGEIATVKCLYSTIRLWKRFENCVAAAKRLFEEDRLHNSWEIMSSAYTYKDGIKHLNEYSFIGNCLLGTSYPAYGRASKVTAETAEAEYDPELMIAEALSADLMGSESASNIAQEEGGTPEMEVNENNVENLEVKEEAVEAEVVETNKSVEETAEDQEVQNDGEVVESESNEAEVSVEDPEVEESEADNEKPNEETSAMKTSADVRKMLYAALKDVTKQTNEYCWIAMIFPEDHVILVQSDEMDELIYYKYTYAINGDKAELGEREKVEMVISPLRVNSEIEAKNSAIAEANNRIVELENQNAELVKAKEELDKIKADQAEVERSQAVEKLRTYVENSGRFSKEELESEDIQNHINNLDESWLKAEIADRFMKTIEKPVETSEAEKSLGIVLSEENKPVSYASVMAAFFND